MRLLRPLFLFLLFLFLLFPFLLPAQQIIDTVRIEGGELYGLRYMSVVSADSMSKAALFMRGIKPGELKDGTFRRLDSIVVYNAAGERQAQDPKAYRRKIGSDVKESFAEPTPIRLLATNVYLRGRIGEEIDHEFKITNNDAREKILRVIEGGEMIEFSTDAFRLAPKSAGAFRAKTILPAGSLTEKVAWQDTDDENKLELTFIMLGYDLVETDFVASRERARLQPWQVPEGRETLYLRLESTEKLMTIYQNGRPYKKVAVGRQLDEVSLLALPRGDFMLEVIDLGSGEKRYHALRR